MGFLLSGMLGDYEEAERMPGELAASIEALVEEGQAVLARSGSPAAEDFPVQVEDLGRSIPAWFHKRERTGAVLDRLASLNAHFAQFESLAQIGCILRMKQEQPLNSSCDHSCAYDS